MMKKKMKAFVFVSSLTVSSFIIAPPFIFAEETVGSITSATTVQPVTQIMSTKTVDYPATISRGTDGINSKPWGTEGYQTLGYSDAYLGMAVSVSQEQVTDNDVTWALISLNGKELGWIAKAGLSAGNYVQILSTKDVDYPAKIINETDGINTLPWGTKGYQTVGYSSAYLEKNVAVSQEQVTDNGVTWALISLDGKELGWIAKTGLRAGNYAQVLSTQEADYPAIISRETDGINTLPWGTKSYQTIGLSADYLGAEVTVSQEQVTDNGVTWALAAVNGQQLGWIAKAALTIQDYAQIVSTKDVNYPAAIKRGTDSINTQPWGMKGYRTVASSSAYLGKDVTVSREQVMDSGMTWAFISINGQEVGWIAKDALYVYNTILSTTAVDYPAVISRGTDSINTQPWGTQGCQGIGLTDDYLWTDVTVSQEKVADYGVTWALVSINGKQLGWMAKNALSIRNYAKIVSTKTVDYPAIIERGTDGINTLPWGTKGNRTIGYSADYLDAEVIVKQEQVTDSGVTWALLSLNGKELGWIAKDALDVRAYVKIVSTTNVAYQATIIRTTDGINTLPWGTKGYKTIGYSSDYQWKTVSVSQEQVTDTGVIWALISLNGQKLGWIAKDAFYDYVVSTKNTSYKATISREKDGINTLPWGTKGFQSIGNSSDYLWKEVVISQEKVTATGVTWALISLNGQRLGWITKAALTPKFISDVPLVTTFVNSIVAQAHNLSGTYGLYTSVMIAQAALESAWGQSTLSKEPNYNLFGIKGEYNGASVTVPTKEYVAATGTWITINAQFQKYPSYRESLQANAKKLANGVYWDANFYNGTWRVNTTSYKDSTAWLTGRYATDPAYNTKLNSIIEKYALWKYDLFD